jgi:hypothetical protein
VACATVSPVVEAMARDVDSNSVAAEATMPTKTAVLASNPRSKVTGAEPRARVEILLVPTPGSSIQPGCDRPG